MNIDVILHGFYVILPAVPKSIDLKSLMKTCPIFLTYLNPALISFMVVRKSKHICEYICCTWVCVHLLYLRKQRWQTLRNVSALNTENLPVFLYTVLSPSAKPASLGVITFEIFLKISCKPHYSTVFVSHRNSLFTMRQWIVLPVMWYLHNSLCFAKPGALTQKNILWTTLKLFKLTTTLELAGIFYPQHSSSYAVRRRVECAGGNMRNASFKTYRHG